MRTHAHSARTTGRTPANEFPCNWTAATGEFNSGTSTSAIGALVAAAGLK